MQSNGERPRAIGFLSKLSRHNDLRTRISSKVLSRWLETMGAPASGWSDRDSAQQKAEYLAAALYVRRHGQTRSRLSGLATQEVDTIAKLYCLDRSKHHAALIDDIMELRINFETEWSDSSGNSDTDIIDQRSEQAQHGRQSEMLVQHARTSQFEKEKFKQPLLRAGISTRHESGERAGVSHNSPPTSFDTEDKEHGECYIMDGEDNAAEPCSSDRNRTGDLADFQQECHTRSARSIVDNTGHMPCSFRNRVRHTISSETRQDSSFQPARSDTETSLSVCAHRRQQNMVPA